MKHRIIRTNGQRIAFTNTSRIPDEEWIAAIKQVAEHADLDRTVIHAKRHGHNRRTLGMAYPEIPWEANLDGLKRHEWHYLITVTDRYSGEPRTARLKMDSHIFSTLAHEAKHVADFKHYGSRPPRCEEKARAFADWMVERYDPPAPAIQVPASP